MDVTMRVHEQARTDVTGAYDVKYANAMSPTVEADMSRPSNAVQRKPALFSRKGR
jgi:hypothetical protein